MIGLRVLRSSLFFKAKGQRLKDQDTPNVLRGAAPVEANLGQLGPCGKQPQFMATASCFGDMRLHGVDTMPAIHFGFIGVLFGCCALK